MPSKIFWIKYKIRQTGETKELELSVNEDISDGQLRDIIDETFDLSVVEILETDLR